MYKELIISALTLSFSVFSQSAQADPSAIGCGTYCTQQACAGVDVARKCLNECKGVLLHKVCENTVAAADKAEQDRKAAAAEEELKRTVNVDINSPGRPWVVFMTDVMSDYKELTSAPQSGIPIVNHNSHDFYRFKHVIPAPDIKGAKTVQFRLCRNKNDCGVHSMTPDQYIGCGSAMVGKPINIVIWINYNSRRDYRSKVSCWVYQ